jgi:tetratricopeptide (TPR) repeat protein
LGLVLLVAYYRSFWSTSVLESAKRQPASDIFADLTLSDVDPDLAATVQESMDRIGQAPNSSEAWGHMGCLLIANGLASKQAMLCLEKAERLDPTNLRWPYFQGVQLSRTDPNGAIRKLRRAVQIAGSHATPQRLRLAEMLLGQDLLDEAEEQLSLVLGSHPNHPQAKLGLARVALRRGNAADAQRLAKDVQPIPPVQKSRQVLLTEIYQRLGDAQMADESAKVANRLPNDPPWPDPLIAEVVQLRQGLRPRLAYADNLLAQNKPDEAIQSLEGTIAQYPKSDWGHLLMGRALLEKNDLDAAQVSFSQAIQLNDSAVEAMYYLATTHLLKKDESGAEKWYRAAITRKPDFAMAHYNLGHALQDLNRAIAIDPGYTATDFNANRGTQTVEEGAEAIVRYAMLGPDGPTGGFFDRNGAEAW